MRHTSEKDRTLIWIALKGGKARAHWNHGAFRRLDEAGLSVTIKRWGVYHTHKLTSAGIEAVLNMPDNLEADFYPLPEDIAKAKEIVRRLK